METKWIAIHEPFFNEATTLIQSMEGNLKLLGFLVKDLLQGEEDDFLE